MDKPANSVKWWSSGFLHNVMYSACSKVSEKYAVTIFTVTAFGSRTLKEILYIIQEENPEDHPYHKNLKIFLVCFLYETSFSCSNEYQT
jgi:hypothetical protein